MNGKGIRTRMRAVTLLLIFFGLGFLHPAYTRAQESTDTVTSPDSVVEQGSPLPPVYAVLGLGYGMRSDGCVLCESPEEDSSFSVYLGVVRPLGKGFGVGLDVNLWRRGRPGTPGPLDPEGVPEPIPLSNTLANLSVSFSYDYWQLFVHAGAGLAFGSQDLEMENPEGAIIIHTASGLGPGFTAGAGITIPVASMVSLAFYGNLNVGHYDMVSPQGLTERSAKHQYLELGVGVGMR